MGGAALAVLAAGLGAAVATDALAAGAAEAMGGAAAEADEAAGSGSPDGGAVDAVGSDGGGVAAPPHAQAVRARTAIQLRFMGLRYPVGAGKSPVFDNDVDRAVVTEYMLAIGATEHFSFDVPLQADAGVSNGRVAYTDMHVGIALDHPATPKVVPDGCAVRDLDSQEKAMEYILLDLTSCLTPAGGEQAGP